MSHKDGEALYLMTTKDGIAISVPESQLEAFEEAQKNPIQLTPEEEAARDERLHNYLHNMFSHLKTDEK